MLTSTPICLRSLVDPPPPTDEEDDPFVSSQKDSRCFPLPDSLKGENKGGGIRYYSGNPETENNEVGSHTVGC
jgi:hypothetical protein